MKYNKHLYTLGMIGCLILGLTPVIISMMYNVLFAKVFNTYGLRLLAFVLFVSPVLLAYWFTLKLWDYKEKSKF